MYLLNALIDLLSNTLVIEYWISGYSSEDGEEDILMNERVENVAKMLELAESLNYGKHHPDAFYKAYWGGHEVKELSYWSDSGKDVYAFALKYGE